MVLTILLAAPGLLILLVPAATPLFRLWDHRSYRARFGFWRPSARGQEQRQRRRLP